MVKYLHYLEALGGPFIITSPLRKNLWLGADGDSSSYEQLIEFCDQSNGDQSQIIDFQIDDLSSFLVFNSASKNLKIFETPTGFVLCEQYYLSQSWDSNSEIEFDIVSVIDLSYENTEETLVIFDATMSGVEVTNLSLGSFKSLDSLLFEDYAVLNLTVAKYELRKVRHVREDLISLTGIEFKRVE